MGAKTCLLIYSDGNEVEILQNNPVIDRVRSKQLLKDIFPSQNFKTLDDVNLHYTYPNNNEVYIGYFKGLCIIISKDFAVDHPSHLSQSFLRDDYGSNIHLHVMHSVVDWFAYAYWKNNHLHRALSISPDNGVIEDIGTKVPFETPYWEGQYSVYDSGVDENEQYPLPFHPLELAEEALYHLLGYQLEGPHPSLFNAEEIPLMAFQRQKPWWKLW